MGWLARRHGLQCNHLLAAELVTADGEIVRTDADHDPELFWALRGGGAQASSPRWRSRCSSSTPSSTGYLAWDWTAVDRVLPAWVDWCGGARRGDDVLPAGGHAGRGVLAGRRAGPPAGQRSTAPCSATTPSPPRCSRRRCGRWRGKVGSVSRAGRANWSGCTLGRRGQPPRTPAARAPSPGCPTPRWRRSSVLGPPRARASPSPSCGSWVGRRRPDPAGGALSWLDGEFLALGLGLGADVCDVREDAAPLPHRSAAWNSRRKVMTTRAGVRTLDWQVEQLQARRVDPVHVLVRLRHGAVVGETGQLLDQNVERALLPGVRSWAGGRIALAHGDAQQRRRNSTASADRSAA